MRKPYTDIEKQIIIGCRYHNTTWKLIAKRVSAIRGERVKKKVLRHVIYAYWFKDGLAELTERKQLMHQWATYKRGIRLYIQTESGHINFGLHRKGLGESPQPVPKVNYETLETLETRLKALKTGGRIRDYQVLSRHTHHNGHRAPVGIAML